MALILQFYEGEGVFVDHVLKIPKEKIDEVIAKLYDAKSKGEDVILPSERLQVFYNMSRSNGQVRIGFDGPQSFDIKRDSLNSYLKKPPHPGGIAG